MARPPPRVEPVDLHARLAGRAPIFGDSPRSSRRLLTSRFRLATPPLPRRQGARPGRPRRRHGLQSPSAGSLRPCKNESHS